MSENHGGIIRVEKNRNYSVTNNTGAHDKRLSWGAKGILWYALTRPDNWVLTVKDLVSYASEGEAAVKARLKELKQCGYLKKERFSVNGNFEWRTTIYEVPQDADFSHSEVNAPSGDIHPMQKTVFERETPSGGLHPMLLHPMQNRPIYKGLNKKELNKKELNVVEEVRARRKAPPPPQIHDAIFQAIFDVNGKVPNLNDPRDKIELEKLVSLLQGEGHTDKNEAAAAIRETCAFWPANRTPPHLSQIFKDWHTMKRDKARKENQNEQLSRQPATNSYTSARQRIADEQRRVCAENGIEF